MLRTNKLVPTILVQNESYWLPYVLESLRGYFDRYIIYDVGSTDNTREIVDNFVQSERHNSEFFVRMMPKCEPIIQGAFRNSMIAEARCDYYFIVDGDELYTPESLKKIIDSIPLMERYYLDGLLYGMLPRIEIQADLKTAYGVNEGIPHHRLYHRTAIFGGAHPGEYPIPEQRGKNQMWLSTDILCWHFHGTARSPKDAETHGRLDRKKKPTYLRGALSAVDIIKELPLLAKPINGFEVNPELKKLQEVCGVP